MICEPTPPSKQMGAYMDKPGWAERRVAHLRCSGTLTIHGLQCGLMETRLRQARGDHRAPVPHRQDA